MDFNSALLAFGLTLFAGLSTGIGSALAFLVKQTNTHFLSVSMGFSAGVMVYVSFVEIMVKARDALTEQWGDKLGAWGTVAAFFSGMAVIALVDKFVPSAENPHESHTIEEMSLTRDEHELKHGV